MTPACARPLRVLVAHNAYQQRGGEDAVVDAEIALLRAHGHTVDTLVRHNDELVEMSRLDALRQTFWSARTTVELRQRLQAERPDVIHAHNTFPLISPSLFWAAADARIPVVQTLHNFRLQCLQATHLREDRICEDCIGHLPWRGVVRRCYRDSALQSAALAGMIAVHRGLGTWQRKVARFIALNGFCKAKLAEGGLPADKIVVKPNFVDIADAPPDASVARRGLLYVGRLSPEKGVRLLAQAQQAAGGLPLRVVGSGPLAPELAGVDGLTPLGALDAAAVQREMRGALALVIPSTCYESFPRTLVEAMACRLPVIASRLGPLAELVQDGRQGLLFEPGDPADLARRLAWALAHPQDMARMGDQARADYEARYTGERNHQQLRAIYDAAIAEGSQRAALQR